MTGSSGFIGRHVVTRLIRDGWQVTGVDLRSMPTTTVEVDVRRYLERRDLPHFDLVIHAAANVGGRKAIDEDPLWVADDFSIDAAVIRWAARWRPGRLVYFSSSAAYPIDLQREESHRSLREGDIDLEDVAEPDAIYGWVKLTGERLAVKLREAGVPVTVLRPFSGYGGDQALDYPFPSFIRRAQRGEDPFEIWGPGTQVRDWVHVDDVIETVMACAEGEIDGPLNIGTGIPTSFLTLANMVTSALNEKPELKVLPEAPTGVFYRVANVAKLQAVHVPQVTLEEGIHRALNGRS